MAFVDPFNGPKVAGCPVCGGDCNPTPAVEHLASYPFLPGGEDPMAGQEYVITPERIHDPELERFVYGAGDRVPLADAVKYGLVKPDKKERAKHGPEQDRSKRRKVEDR